MLRVAATLAVLHGVLTFVVAFTVWRRSSCFF